VSAPRFWNPQEQHAPGFSGEFSVLHVIVLLDFVKMPLDSPFDRSGLLPSKKCYLQGLSVPDFQEKNAGYLIFKNRMQGT
jgi:hypothetical protein